MSNEVLSNIKSGASNNLKKLRANNEANRLEEKVKAYNKNMKNSKSPNSGDSSVSDRLNKSRNKNSGDKNSAATNKLASAGAQAVGVPKPIADAAVNSKLGQKAISSLKKKNPMLNTFDKLTGGGKKESMEEQSAEGNGENAKIPKKVIRYAFIFLVTCYPLIIFCCLLLTASHVVIKSLSLGNADSLGSEGAEKKIKKKLDKDEDDLNSEADDKDLAINISYNSKSYKFLVNKLSGSNMVLSNANYLERKYNEADLAEIEDFYPAIVDESKNYDKNMVYDFYFKMYNLYKLYRDKYNVYLDLPLLMSTLNVQSDDMYEIFSSNLSPEDRKKTVRKNYDNMDYFYDWSGYITTSKNSEHDMEVLAQHMVQQKPSTECEQPVNDVCYVIDNEKYREFLKEFLEKKYYLKDKVPLSKNEILYPSNTNQSSPQSPESGNSSSGGNQGTPSSGSGEWRNWTQCGQSWSNLIIPHSDIDMCNAGCLITSITMQIVRSGTYTVTSPVDPGVVLNYYNFVDGGWFVWQSTTNLAPNFKYYTSIELSGMSKQDIASKLKSFDSSKYYIILAVSPMDFSYITHYVAFDYVDDSYNIYMADPVSTKYKELYSKYRLYQARIYVKED